MKFTLLSVIAAVVAIVAAVPLETGERPSSCPSCKDYFLCCIRDNCGADRRVGDNSCLEACRVGTNEWDYSCHTCRLPGDPVIPSAAQDVQSAPEVRYTVPGTQHVDYVDCVECMDVANHCVASICGDNWSNMECKVACIKAAREGHGGLCHYCPMPESAIGPFGRPPYGDAQPAINSREVVPISNVGTPFCKSCTLHFQQCLRNSCDSSPSEAALCSEECIDETSQWKDGCLACPLISQQKTQKLKARQMTCHECHDRYNFCIEEGGNHGIGACEKTCAKRVCAMDSICKSCDSFVDKC